MSASPARRDSWLAGACVRKRKSCQRMPSSNASSRHSEGELTVWEGRAFKDLDQVENRRRVFPNYATAYAPGKPKALKQTVGQRPHALFIVHLHRLLDPRSRSEGPGPLKKISSQCAAQQLGLPGGAVRFPRAGVFAAGRRTTNFSFDPPRSRNRRKPQAGRRSSHSGKRQDFHDAGLFKTKGQPPRQGADLADIATVNVKRSPPEGWGFGTSAASGDHGAYGVSPQKAASGTPSRDVARAGR